MSDNSNMDDFLNNLRESRRNELAELRIQNQSGVSRLINANPNLINSNNEDGERGPNTPSANANSSDLDEELRNLMQSQRVSGLLNNMRFRETLQARLNSSLQSLAESQASSASRSSERSGIPPSIPASVTSAAPPPPVTTATNTSQSVPQVTVEDVLDPQNDPEISALVNYQIVSGILQSAFRSHLESTIWSRYVSRQAGINLAQEDAQQRNTATTGTSFNPPSSATNRVPAQPMPSMSMNNSSMLQHMQQQITDIRSMITILVQSQIESQRYIRSEVSQLFNRLNSAENIQLGSPQASGSEVSNPCCICLDNESDTMVYRCGHVCLCYPCSVSLRINQASNRGNNSTGTTTTNITCPVCRSPAQDIVRVFSASQHQLNPAIDSGDLQQQPQGQ